MHGGVQTVLASLRSKFWPIHGRIAVKSITNRCLVCFKARPRCYKPIMGNLPTARVTPSRPLLNVGIDFAGPFIVKDGTIRTRKMVQTYVCVFICFSTKAIHLELAGSLSTECFINCLKRLVARRGLCKRIYTDNGANFIGVKKTLKNTFDSLMKLSGDDSVKKYLLHNRIIWHFSPPRAPNFGGL